MEKQIASFSQENEESGSVTRKHSFLHSLHLKVIAGYILMIGLLAVILLVMHFETDKLVLVRTGELRREAGRELIYRISGKLLDITIPGELLPLWEETDFARYHEDNQEAIAALDDLKVFYPGHSQCARIDSVRTLLEEKEVQIGKLYGLFNPENNGKSPRISITASHADSLKRKNQELNSKLDHIIHAFEQEAVEQMESERGQQHAIRKDSFRILSSIMVLSFSLAVIFYILIHRDIRKKADYRRKIETTNHDNHRLLSLHRRMVLSILHDLRSPLGIISGYAELAKMETDEMKRAMQVESILTSSRHMLSLTEDLLEYYRLDTGSETPSPSTFSADVLIQELENHFRPMAESKGLAFNIDYRLGRISLTGDRERLYRIASNLLSNAIKFTSSGSVIVSVNHADGTLTLQVQDTGTGMNAEEMAKIFNPFERLENAGEAAGFGLGLSITAGLVTLLEGKIHVESQPGKGSLFTVRLPMCRTTSHREKKTVAENNSLNYPLRLLIIDDDPMQITLMREMLRLRGIACDCCDCADTVMELLQTERYDLLITDIQMPVTDGFALLRMLRESEIPQARSISVLAMTARIDLCENDYIRQGFAGCLLKPFTLSTLISSITGQDCLLANGEDISFELVLYGEKNQPEMLELFIGETRKNIDLLHGAMQSGDMETLSAILHKVTPLWATLGVHIPYHPTEDELPVVFRQGEWLIRRATQLYHSTTDQTREYEVDTDYRG